MGVLGGMSAKSREKRARRGLEAAGARAEARHQPFYDWGLEALYGPNWQERSTTTTTGAPANQSTQNAQGLWSGQPATDDNASAEEMAGQFATQQPSWGGGQAVTTTKRPPATGPLPTDIASLRDLINNPEQIRSDPQYQFLAQEGGRAVGNILSGRGKLLSGEGGRNFQSFGQNLASTFLNSIIDRRMTGINTLFKQLGIGQNAATAMGNIATGTATNVAQTLQGQDPLLAGIQQGVGGAMGMQASGMFGGGGVLSGGAAPRQGNARFAPTKTFQWGNS